MKDRQARIAGTTRPESAPRIRTEGREADGPLFTQERDARERAEARAQRGLFEAQNCPECDEPIPADPVREGDSLFCSVACRDESAERVADAYARMDWGK